ncbi:MAG: hypothetical protein ACLPOA_18395 [Methylocella sp.]
MEGSASLSVQIALVWQDHPGANRDRRPLRLKIFETLSIRTVP